MKKLFRNLSNQKTEINYLYFSFFLVFLISLSLFHSTYREIPLFFIFYAIGQSFFEVCLLILIDSILKRWVPRWIYILFILTSFTLLLLHFTHFTMVRLMDTNLNYIFKFLFGSGIDHLLAGLQALNMNGAMIGIILLSFILIPSAGLVFFWITNSLSNLNPLKASFRQLILILIAITSILFTLDLTVSSRFPLKTDERDHKILPLGTRFLSPTLKYLAVENSSPPILKEEELLETLPPISLTHRPNIYFFIIETLRKDYLNIAPHLSSFSDENIHFTHSFANANSTHLSWFSLFHSDIPLQWTTKRDHWHKGSLPLQYLKKLGYRIRVYSSADLKYFKMDQLLFGDERKLADHIEEYSLNRTIEPCERDALCFASIKRDLEKEGNVYLIFLDSTHSEYSFPSDFPLQFQPIANRINYLTIAPHSPELEHIKNRYRNAIRYVDDLMGQFFDLLKEKELFDEGIIAITGDHGEEFFEEGALFHGTHLNEYQTNVPILLKVPSKKWISQTEEASHIDLFPSILHYLTNQNQFASLCDGRSIFGPDRHLFRTTILQNGADTPIEFCVEKRDLKLQARFVSPTKIEVIELQGFLEPATLFPLIKYH